MLRLASVFLSLTVALLLPGCDSDEDNEMQCADQAPAADVSCGDISDTAEAEECALDAIAAGASFSLSSRNTGSSGDFPGQFDSSTTRSFFGDFNWVRRSGVEDLCTLDSLELVRTEGLASCATLDCILDAGVDYTTCFDAGNCDAV